jgi:alpha-tubulin suppressor-like RCC1 family protein
VRGGLAGIGVALLAALSMAGAPSAAAAASTSPGQLYAFGENRYGQLGSATNNKTSEPNPAPTLLVLPGASGPVTQISAGEAHSLAVTSTGQLYAFGNNGDGQLGSATNNKTVEPNPTPTLVALPGASGPVTQIAAGGHHSLAVTSTGQLYAFGINYYGQLGSATNNTTEEPNPTPTLVALPGASGPVTQIAASNNHTLALTSTGQLYAFGENRYGQLGSAINNNSLAPNPTPTLVALPGASGLVTQIAAGANHSLAVTSTGQLYAFGDNYSGQLGSATNSTTVEPNPTPTLVALPGASGPVIKIAAGASHSLAVTSTGQLFAFGYNYDGQLGSATNNKISEPNPTPTLVALPGASGPVTQIAASRSHSLAVTSTGQLYTFGSNSYGQLGSATNSGTTNANPTPALVGLPAGTTVDTIARGSNAAHTLVLIADLTVTSASLPAGQVGVPYFASGQASGGVPPQTWTGNGLPAGLTINPASGQITGTPTAPPGNASVLLSVTDAYGISATSAPIPLSIAPATLALISSISGGGEIGPTVAQIKASLLSQLLPEGKAAKIAALLKKGYFLLFRALTAGSVLIDWYYLPHGAHVAKAKPKPVLVAAGHASFSHAGSFKLTIKLTANGKQLLKRAKRLTLTAKGTFTPSGKQPITATRRLILKR